MEQHPTLREGQATIEAAEQRVWQEKSVYLPEGGYVYRLTRQQIPLVTAVGGIDVGGGAQTRRTSQTFNFHATNFNIRQLLFDFDQTLDTIRAAAARVDASRSDLDVIRQTVIFNTKQAYYGLLSAQRLQLVAEETVEQNQQHLDEAQARFEVGVAPRFDVTQAQVQVSNARLDLVTARNNVSLARETLRTAMGIIGAFSYTPVDPLAHRLVAFDEDALLTTAYRNRPELRSMQAQQRAASQRVSALQKQYLPSVLGDAQYSWTGREMPLQDGWQWGLTLSVPIFDNIRTVGEVGESQAELRRLKAREQDLRLQISLGVRQSILNVHETAERIRVSEQIVAQAQENLDLAEGRYSAGVGNIIELTDAQVSLTSARARNVEAVYTYKTALAELERAVGQRVE